ncbi:hypothetical protein [Halarsenatibacter silvermanii]|uniref:Uncharacterized protein n=1 Tax=Halarsenatibacter silvermanii TaxID=321763 RepID=A0A1G9KS76_9FIRM|nr:hypothetical protein [Halarsenatibacter silvermanii]SDL52509.1 hypothetical protein SAMN04488692_10589 [Halarsenatibacter silvermanii]
MKKIFILTFCLIFLLAFTASAQPQPPQIFPAFDLDLNYLSVDITHQFEGDGMTEHIQDIIIFHDGKEVITQSPGRQLEETETFLYYMPAVTQGDEIKIEIESKVAGGASVTFQVRGDYLTDNVVE